MATFSKLYAVLLAGSLMVDYLAGGGLAYRIADPIITFFTHLPPLLVLKHTLHSWYQHHPLFPINPDPITATLNRYNLSKREAEIVGLLLKGKSYRYIEDELFISLKTVKIHIYNIYKKMGIKSR